MEVKVDPILGCEREEDRFKVYTASRRRVSRPSYFQMDGLFMNEVGIPIYEDCVLRRVKVVTKGNASWTAEIHNNEVPIAGSSVTVLNDDNGNSGELYIEIPAGARLMFYCSSSISVAKRARVIIELSK